MGYKRRVKMVNLGSYSIENNHLLNLQTFLYFIWILFSIPSDDEIEAVRQDDQHYDSFINEGYTCTFIIYLKMTS